jgi:TonB-dependent receptor
MVSFVLVLQKRKQHFISFGGLNLKFKHLLSFLLVIILSFNFALSQQTGIISGAVVDAKTGDPLISATVRISDTQFGARTKFDGTYRIANIPAGSYTITVNYVGYQNVEIQSVVVEPGAVKKLNISMQDQSVLTDEVVVTAEAIRTTEAALLKDRQKSESVSDAIGAEQISRGGAGDAGDAIKKVTGATTVGGKYVYVRGLGDRYTQTQLNGAELASADPDKKSVHLDLFPSGLIENIKTIKTATPDKPGNFTGGTVDISTKSFPDKFNLSVSVSSSYNTQVTGSDNFLTSTGSGSDWLGYDDGTRSLPALFDKYDSDYLGSLNSSSNGAEDQQVLNEMSQAFAGREMVPFSETAPMNTGFSISVGDQHQIGEGPIGYVASLSYKNSYSSYNDGEVGIYSLGPSNARSLIGEHVVGKNESFWNPTVGDSINGYDAAGDRSVLWGAMATVTYNFLPKHKISLTGMYNQSGDMHSRYQIGQKPVELPGAVYETRVLHYTERSINSLQLSGDHFLPFLNEGRDIEADWMVSYNASTQEEPDLRFFSNDYLYRFRANGDTVLSYNISSSSYDRPQRYFRDLTEDVISGRMNLTFPIVKNKFDFKTGFAYSDKSREYSERLLEYSELTRYTGNPAEFFDISNMGITEGTAGNNPVWGNTITDNSQPAGTYDGFESVTAFYGMVDWFILDKFRVIGGVRYEKTDIEVISKDTSTIEDFETGELISRSAALEENDILPSVNLVYEVYKDMNLRLAYGRTLARPNFRELTPYSTFDFAGGYILIGNPKLKRTLVDNFDLRWEWFLNPGELLAVSAFYKDFTNPIEKQIISDDQQIKYNNVDKATLMGLEFEFRKNLGVISELLNKVQFGMNFTLVNSNVDVAARDRELIENYNEQIDELIAQGETGYEKQELSREFQGQSPYILNLDMAYIDPEIGTSVSLNFNVFGERLSEVAFGPTPDVYEQPAPDLNLVISQDFLKNFQVKFSAKNILNPEYKKTQVFYGEEYVFQSYTRGSSYSLGFSYKIQ